MRYIYFNAWKLLEIPALDEELRNCDLKCLRKCIY